MAQALATEEELDLRPEYAARGAVFERTPKTGDAPRSLRYSSGARTAPFVESALAYLERHSTPAARAHLVTAFPNVSSERRVVLLEAYARANPVRQSS